ncbi:MAG: cation:proton antiporter [Akkermansiaceae bacterium]
MNLVAILLLTAAAAYGIARWLRLPSLPILIGAGMALNLAGFLPEGFQLGGGQDDEHAGAALRILELGLVFLVFASGVELNPRRFVKRGATVAWVGCVQFGVSALIGFGTSRWMGFGNVEAAYLGFGLAASSTLVVLNQLRSRHAMFEPFGRLVTGVLLLQDALLIAVIVVLSRWAEGSLGIGLGLGEAGLLGAAAWLSQRYVIPQLVKRTKPDEESLLLWLVAVLFVFVGIAFSLGLPPIVGAFAGGFAFSAFPLNGLVRAQLSSLSDFFQALFFVALGALVGVPDAAQWWTALQFSAIVIFVTPPLVMAMAEWRGMSTRASIESGLLLAQTSEFSLLLGVSGLALGHLSTEGFGILALTTVITMTLTPLIGREQMARLLLPLHPFRRHQTAEKVPSGHVLLLGFGAAGMWTVKPLIAQGEEVLVVDDDAVVCAELARRGVRVLRGDGSEKEILQRAGAADAKLVIASMRRVGDALKVLEHVRDVPVVARVFEEGEAAQILAAGGIPVMNSQAAAETFIEWFVATSDTEPKAEGPRSIGFGGLG